MAAGKPKLRSQDACARSGRGGFSNRRWMKSSGLPGSAFDGRAVIAICNTWSDNTWSGHRPCSAHLHKNLVQRILDVRHHCDTRMSSTVIGNAILHGTPQSEARGLLAFFDTGDEILFDSPARKPTHSLSEQDNEPRPAAHKIRPAHPYKRGYYRHSVEHVLQTDRGCDLNFLVGAKGSAVIRESH